MISAKAGAGTGSQLASASGLLLLNENFQTAIRVINQAGRAAADRIAVPHIIAKKHAAIRHDLIDR